LSENNEEEEWLKEFDKLPLPDIYDDESTFIDMKMQNDISCLCKALTNCKKHMMIKPLT